MYRKDLAFPSQDSETSGKKFWQSYEQWRESPEVEKIVEREFPVDASIFSNPLSRRHFLKIMGASMALAGLTSCIAPVEKIVGAVKSPAGMIPGKSVFYARSLNRGGFAVGVLVESFMGRPIKIEGNSDHPMSLGASDIFLQAELLNLYDPDRLAHPMRGNAKTSWSEFEKAWSVREVVHHLDQGAGLRILCERSTSDTLLDLTDKITKKFPKAKIVLYDPISRDQLQEAVLDCYQRPLEPFYDFSKAQVIVSFDRDFFSDEAAGLRYSHDFADNRRLSPSQNKKMNRLYSIESDFSLTGGMADHRLGCSRVEMESLISRLAFKLGVSSENSSALSSKNEKWVSSMVTDLQKNQGSSLIIASETLSAKSQCLVFQMNEKLKNTGTTLVFYKPAYKSSQELENLKTLSKEMNEGKVTSLIILSQNPVYTSPKDLEFETAMNKVPFTVTLTHAKNETSEKSLWVLPESHSLESWSDARAIDGTLSINQPLIAPLFDSISGIEVLSIILKGKKIAAHQLVKDYWGQHTSSLTFKDWWENSLRQGYVTGSAYQVEKIKASPPLKKKREATSNSHELELHLKPDPTLRDGHFANNGWLQELPKPITKLCWSNAASISPALAAAHSLNNGDEISVQTNGRKLDIPVWIVPGLADKVIIAHFGHGRRTVGRVGTGIGSDAFQLLHSDNIDGVVKNISFSKKNISKKIACTQAHHEFSSAEPLKVKELKNYSELEKIKHHDTLIPESPIPVSKDYAWGMNIDLNVCTGCNACVIGCQSENNIPIVGEEEVLRGREMHWLRIDRYFEGAPDFAKLYFQPLACVHCEKAPCEVVCPVAATTHSTEGINQMVYNRCVGTRYCSNNCPYKVRRFNFFDYNAKNSEYMKMKANPEVSVRSRGVMEKCTYCIQRINKARVTAEIDGRKIKDGEIQTACQQACATKAIVFGNLLDTESEVSKLHNSVQAYELLGELGTLPRTRYLTRFTNSNPELAT